MAKYFLGSVGSVEAFERKSDGTYELAFTSKTLTDSGINTTITKDDIRGGENATIQFSFFHDPSVEVTLTDVVFKKEYLEAQLGVEFTKEGAHGYNSETVTAGEGSLTLTQQPLALDFGACGDVIDYVWATELGKDEWKAYKFTGKTVTNEAFTAGKKYCVRYCYSDPNALIATVTSSIIPKEYMLIVTAPVFAGDACSASQGKKAGTITYEFPRFRLNGGADLAFNMSSNQTMSLAGTVYAADTSCEVGAQNLYNVIISINDGSAKITQLVVDEDSLTNGGTPVVYGLLSDGKLSKLDNAKDLTFNPELTTGTWATGSVTITLKADPEVTDTVTVA